MAVLLFEHNVETYEKMEKMFESTNRVGVVQPTGTGKSFLILKWIEDYAGDSFIILAPSNEIFSQLKNYASLTDEEDILSGVRMLSYQALNRMEAHEIEKICAQRIVLDEYHRAGAEQWGDCVELLLSANPHSRILGLTATPVRYLDDFRDMSEEIFSRNLAVEMTLGEAVARNILPEPIYIPVYYDIDGRMDRYEQDIEKMPDREERDLMKKELDKAKKQLLKAYGPDKIFQRYLKGEHEKLIVFCRSVVHVHEMIPVMESWLAGTGKDVHSYISVSELPDKDEQLLSFRKDHSENTIKLLFTVDRLNEGVHVKDIDGVIMLRPTVSPIIYLQQIGRALGSGGRKPLIFDMVNNYANVQIHSTDGRRVNAFESELREYIAKTDEEDLAYFAIFEESMMFEQIFKQMESVLYSNHDSVWLKNLELYKEFKEETGREPKQKEAYKGVKLGTWVRTQRTNFAKGLLTEEKENLLRVAGFVFDPLEEQWDQNLELYKEFKEETGREPRTQEVYKDVKIGSWVNNQRRNFAKGLLSEERGNLWRNRNE